MNKNLISIFILFFVLVIIFVAAPYSTMIVVNQNSHDKPFGEITNITIVGQSFISTEDNLRTIEILLATYARTNTKDVIFHLKENYDSKEDIVTLVVNAREIQDNSYYSFNFEPIKISKGKSYYFYLESPNSVSGNAITAWCSSNDTYDGGSLYHNHEEIAGDIQFITIYQISIFNILNNFYNRLLQDVPFFISYFASIVILIVLLIKVQFHVYKD